MSDPIWYCTRQRAGPLVKECRALRPRLSPNDTPYERTEKNKILRPPRDSSVCRTRVDRLEIRLALLGFKASVYTLTIRDDVLPRKFQDVRKLWRSYLRQLNIWNPGWSRDYAYLIEGKHGDHRYHVHVALRDEDFPPATARHLWKYGEVDDEPLLRGPYDTFRRTAKYWNKESTDGVVIPISARTWVVSKSLNAKLPQTEIFRSDSGVIQVPESVRVSGCNTVVNEFGRYHYTWWIERPENSALYLE